MNPLYPALKRLPFSGFQSSLIADRRGSAIRPATQNPEKRQTAPAAGHGWQPFKEISPASERLRGTTGSPDIYHGDIFFLDKKRINGITE
ncbi:MAG: hypothetical protein JRI35_06835 [Deltaproteobacteria bacterium]|nr:hypothetical protein [Deltaproteobacteria bacterium]